MIKRIPVGAFQELFPLIKDTWDEVDQRKGMGFTLEPDLDAYYRIEDAGNFYGYKLGEDGYAIFLTTPSLHVKGTITAMSDVIFLIKDKRGLFSSYLEEIKTDLKAAGVDYLAVTVKSRDKNKLFGLTSFETSYQGAL